MKRVLSVAALALAGSATLVACGSSAPTDASEDEFCSSIESAFTTIGEQGTEDDDEIDISDAIDELEETGTPEDIPDDARTGYENFLDALNEADGKTIEEAGDLEDPTDDDDGEAFYTYYVETCGGATGAE